MLSFSNTRFLALMTVLIESTYHTYVAYIDYDFKSGTIFIISIYNPTEKKLFKYDLANQLWFIRVHIRTFGKYFWYLSGNLKYLRRFPMLANPPDMSVDLMQFKL